MKNYSDNSILDDLRSKDLKREISAFNLIYDTCKEGIVIMVEKNSGSYSDGEDIFQSCVLAFVETIRKDESFILTASIKTYLYSVAYRKWMNVIRDNKTKLVLTDDMEMVLKNKELNVEVFIEQDQYNQEHILFWTNIDIMGGDCKKVLEHYFGYMPLKEIAKIMHITYGSLRDKKARCIKKLKALINENGFPIKTIIK